MHVQSTCICVLIECPRKQHGVHVLVLCMLNQPAVHTESTCIRVLIECPKNDTGTCVLLMLCAEMTHAVKNTHVRTTQALGNMCAPCAEFRDI